MASSSSDFASASATFRQPKHEVFLSFRVEDTCNNFLSHLYEAFRRKGVGAYADFKELPRGEEISHAMLQPIEESMISIILFSQNYATSSWCLDELSKIMECRRSRGQLVVPIFYHVSPSDIPNQTGSFGKAFVEHERSKKDKVQGWKHALTEAGNLSGFTLTGDKPEPIVIEEIVHDVLNKLNRPSKRDYKGLIGIGSPVEQIKSLLCIGGDQDVRIIGIWGMGGIGKTTLAQVVYDEVFAQFENCYFLENVRERSTKPDDVIALRDKLLSNLLNQENLHICTPLIGSTFIEDRLYRKRVLVVLDDVNDLEQLEILGISHDRFGFGSRIIITSRDKQVLLNGSIDGIYEVEELSYNDSLQLFSLFAFKQNHLVDDFKDLSNIFLEYAKGVPIALKVLGSELSQKSKAYWKSALNGLKQYPNPKILSVLKISFDGLIEVEKNIFLDIACFFIGEGRDDVTKTLDQRYNYSADRGITSLIDKCLLNVTKENKLGMHNLLKEMGRHIFRAESQNPEERTRLLTTTEHVALTVLDTESTQNRTIFTRATTKWGFPITNLFLEILTAVCDQLSSPRRPLYPLLGLLTSLSALLICICELLYKVRKEQVSRRRAGTLCYPFPYKVIFRNFAETFGFIFAVLRCIFSTVAYIYFEQRENNPIKLNIFPIVFAACLACSMICREEDKKTVQAT